MALIEIYDAIKKGGYDPVKVYLSVYGQVSKNGSDYLLTSSTNGQVFILNGQYVAQLIGKGLIRVDGFLDAANIHDIKPGHSVPIQVMEKG